MTFFEFLNATYPRIMHDAKTNEEQANEQSLIHQFALIANELQEIEEDMPPVPDDRVSGLATELVTPKPRRLERPLAFIVGHSHKSGGAYSKHLQISEYNFWKRHTTTIADYLLSNFGIQVNIYFRNQGTAKAYSLADKTNPMLTVEAHFNASANPSADGFETLIVKDSVKGGIAALAFNRSYEEANPDIRMRRSYNDGIKELYISDNPNTRRGLYSLTRSSRPSIITEPFYGSNLNDCDYFKLESYCDALAQAYFAIQKEEAN